MRTENTGKAKKPVRTGDTPEFADYRDRAWKHIRELRLGALLNPRTRCRNKAAALISFAGRATLVKAHQ